MNDPSIQAIPTSSELKPLKSPSESEGVSDHYDRFRNTMSITRGARFEANRRLSRKNELSLFTVSVLSIYVMAATLVPIISRNLIPDDYNIIPLSTIVTSVFILVLSHMEAAKNYTARAERMLKCAQKISELHNELQLQIKAGSVTEDSFRKVKDKYDEIIRDFSDNHANVDFFYFMAGHRREFHLEGWRKVPAVLWYKFQYLGCIRILSGYSSHSPHFGFVAILDA
jgi:hypothetical protein